jgi:hypothetical protein
MFSIILFLFFFGSRQDPEELKGEREKKKDSQIFSDLGESRSEE